MYVNRIHVPMPALQSHAAVDMFSQCLCVKTRVLENNLLGKHWGLFSSLGVLHQEQSTLCQGHQLDTRTHWGFVLGLSAPETK